MSRTFLDVINLKNDLISYNLLITNYTYNMSDLCKLLIELEENPTNYPICEEITEIKEDSSIILEGIEDLSPRLINNIQSLNERLEDYSMKKSR